MVNFSIDDMVPLLLFKSEYEFVQNLLDINKHHSAHMNILGQAALPYLALSSYETSRWIERMVGQNLYESNELFSSWRNLFKYFDDTLYSVESFDDRCREMLVVASEVYKGPASVFSFLKKDAAVMMLDDVEVGSTFTCFRYLYDNDFQHGTKLSQDIINKRAQEIGYIIGTHAAALMSLMTQFDMSAYNKTYTFPKLADIEYNFYFSKIKSKINHDSSGSLSDGMLVVLADAYYALGLSTVLREHGIVDAYVSLKMVLLALHHLRSSINKVVSCSHRDQSFPLSSAYRDELTTLFTSDEKRLLEKCKPLRNTLVHYNLPAGVHLESGTLQDLSYEIPVKLTFNTELNWEDLNAEVLRIGDQVRGRLGDVVGMHVWDKPTDASDAIVNVGQN